MPTVTQVLYMLQTLVQHSGTEVVDNDRKKLSGIVTLVADQEKILALLASWSFHRKPTAKRGNIYIEKVLYIAKKQTLKEV